MGWVWVLVPVVAILAGTVSEVIKSRDKQRSLGQTSKELGSEVTRLQQQLVTQQESYEKRIANLETIVTSQAWDMLHDRALPEGDKRMLLSSQSELETVNANLSDKQRAEILAQKMK